MAGANLRRQWLILRALSTTRRGLTVKELAAEYETSQKTIRRDLDSLQELGFPVQETAGPNGRNYWRCEASGGLASLHFDCTEILSLYMARRLLEPLAGTLLWQGARSAFQKIEATLNDSLRTYLQQLDEIIHHAQFRTSCYDEHAQIIDHLIVASEDRTIVGLTYQSARSTEPLSYFVHPYGIVYFKNSIYLVAYSEFHEEIRHFKVDRIQAVEPFRLKFNKPSDFDLSAYHSHTFGVYHEESPPQLIRLRFANTVRQYVLEHQFHDSQQVQEQADGSLLVTFALSSVAELKAWVLSFGPLAEVLEPENLRQEIAEDLQRMLAAYGKTNANHSETIIPKKTRK